MKTLNRKFAGMFGILAVASIGLTACSGGETNSESSEPAPASSSSSSASEMDPMMDLVGSGCAAYAEKVPDGEGSVSGMAQDPVATAASNNPMLTTLSSAISGDLNKDVNLVDTLNSDEFTVFAPVDEAFEKLPEKDLDAVVNDKDMLTDVLTYHVVPGKMSPDELDGMYKTVQGDKVEVTGSGDDMMVNDASVICGGVQTANATVYLVDQVLMPPMKK